MQIPSSGWFPNLIKVKTGLTSAFGHFLGHQTATTKAWRYKHNRKPPFHRLLAARSASNMQIPSSGWFPNLIKVKTGLTSAFGHFLGHLTATTKSWRYKRYKHNRKPPFHRLSAARSVSNMQRPASGWFPNLIKVRTGLTSAFGHFLGHLTATTKAWWLESLPGGRCGCPLGP